jgi:acyl-CoA thioesterase FadM
MELLWRETRVMPAPANAPELCRLFEDAARHHATHLGVGVADLHSTGRAWVLGRFSVRNHAWPAPGQPVDVLTWPSRRTSGIRAWRDFELRSTSGHLLAEATSIWLILDLATRRPTRLPAGLLALEFPARDTDIAPPAAQPDPSGPPHAISTLTVTEADLDENNHANNVAYIAWASAAAGPGLLEELHIDYLGETFLDEQVAIAAWATPRPDGARHLVQRLESPPRLLTRVQSVWRPA